MNSGRETGPASYGRVRGGTAEPWPRAARRAPPARPLRNERIIPQQDVARPPRTGLDLDGLFALALFLLMLFIVQLGMRGAALIAALTPLYLFLRREQLMQVLAPRSFLLIVPALAFGSVLWSRAESATLKYAVELAITVAAGLLLSSARNQISVLRGMSLAFLAYVAISILYGGYVGVGMGSGGHAFAGLTASKNLLADIASTGLVLSAVVGLISLRGRDWFWMSIASAGVVIDAYAVVAARSAGALIGVGMAVGALLGLAPLVFAGRIARAWTTAMVALILIVVGTNYRTLSDAIFNVGASLFDKDPTLTGRTYLWYRARQLIQEQPLLGRGYNAFWLEGDIDAEGLWRYFGVGRGGFTFHNTFIEILVTLGWAGLIVICAVVLVGAAALAVQFVQRPSLTLVFWMCILLYELARTPIETIGITPFYFSTALVYAALGAAFRRVEPRTHLPLRIRPARPGDLRITPIQWTGRQAPGLEPLRLVRRPGAPKPR